MTWETRAWTTTPNHDVMRATSGGRLLGKRIRLILDPRSFETDDLNNLSVEGTVLACSSDGPTLYLNDPPFTVPLIDVLMIEAIA